MTAQTYRAAALRKTAISLETGFKAARFFGKRAEDVFVYEEPT